MATAAALAVVVVLGALVAVLLVGHRRMRTELAATRATQVDLLRRLESLDQPSPASRHPEVEAAEFVITHLGESDPAAAEQEVPGRIEGRLFADIVAREILVKGASWTYGVGRALSAENRNRLRFEVRRETRRATRRRRADVKEALRQYYERQEGDVA